MLDTLVAALRGRVGRHCELCVLVVGAYTNDSKSQISWLDHLKCCQSPAAPVGSPKIGSVMQVGSLYEASITSVADKGATKEQHAVSFATQLVDLNVPLPGRRCAYDPNCEQADVSPWLY